MKLAHIMLLMSAVALGACHREHDEKHDHAAHHSNEEAQEAEAGHHHEDGVITLCPEMAERLGVAVDTARVTPLAATARVSGIIESSATASGTATAPVAGIVQLARGVEVGAEVRAGQVLATIRPDRVAGGDANRVARAELEAAEAELARIKPLWEERLVTLAQYNEAKAAAERARAAFSSSAAACKVVAPVSGAVSAIIASQGQFVDAGAAVASVAGQGALTLRADVPSRVYASLADVVDARVVIPYSGETLLMSDCGGRRTGASAGAAAAGYVPVSFTFTSPRAIPGTAVEVYLISSGARPVLSVPESALVEQQGQFFVYERIHDDAYMKHAVEPGGTDGQRREITSGLQGGEAIVSAGTTAVTLAAASGAVPQGHSHAH